MPMFDFYCPRCQTRFEELVADGQTSPPCPRCGAGLAERMVSAPSPLKTGAFPFKPQGTHPAFARSPSTPGACPAGCSGGGACAMDGIE
jgi:putative FmdB family regulatory protein